MVKYEIEGKIIVLQGCTDDVEIVVPETIEGLPVAKVAPFGFQNCENLKKITFPRAMRVIGEYSFAECKKLTEVVFSEGLDTIEDWAFISCNIDRINIPGSLKSIGENAFMGNDVKSQIDKYIEIKHTGKKRLISSKNNACLFPYQMLDNLEVLSSDFIEEKASYITKQLVSMEEGTVNFRDLDVPFVFDGNQAIIGLTCENKVKDFTVTLSSSTQKKIGTYDDEDPDFLSLKLIITGDGIEVGDLTVKTPYLENAIFVVEDVIENQDANGKYRYFLKVKANLSCYGTGNVEREFAMDLFKELQGKYYTEQVNGIISEETYAEISTTIHDVAMDTLKSFLLQVTSAPKLKFMLEALEICANDESMDKDYLNEYLESRYTDIYNMLSSFNSLVDVCYNTEETETFLMLATGLDVKEFMEKYELGYKDDEGNALDFDTIDSTKDTFIADEFNYTLHAEFLAYMYKMMDKLNQDFALKQFQK